MKALAILLLPTLALAAPPSGPRRIGAVIVPMDPTAEASGPKLESYMSEALGQFQDFTVRKSEDFFGLPADDEALVALKRGQQGYQESLAAFDKKEYEDAERKVRATLKELQKAAAAMTASCNPLCDATALYAAVMHQRGDAEEAKLALLDLMALNPTYEMDTKRYSRDFISLRVQVATGVNAALRGGTTVKSRPAGARVFIDNEFKGYTPVTVSTLPVGKHLLRLERPGFRIYGQVLEVSPDESEASTALQPTDDYKAFDARLDNVATEVMRATSPNNPAVAALGKALGLERGLVGTVRDIPDNSTTELVLGLYDMGTGKRLGVKRVVLQGDEFGQLKSEVNRLVNHLLNNADGGAEKRVKSSDPLENAHGMDEWNGEDKGGKRRTQEKKAKKGDPLEGVNGTEDW
ncbi:PEGA domain-containing protein [Vitiosangium sp. GDMCC 1.1324]|uniref:PEGA domain-containing protein n=1 Tax=Vitiosangium sp. (strain GDMCC 1.1324) TaxID=2138576 RepID=UPI000D3BDFB3|nr:PEGA domain-containing protein [Vitiosangium sp. GDMCC 1.1324]PTL80454.1 PEGA domain-containing protein [Vitiosangium sp. GDMCC 1.1324]